MRLALVLMALAAASSADVPQWDVTELRFEAGRESADIGITAEFHGPAAERVTVPGFWDGGRVYRVRWTPTTPGRWTWQTASEDPGLNGKRGEVRAAAPRPGSHGFPRRDPAYPYSFVFDDGTRYFLFGDTYYGLVANAMSGEGWKEAIDRSRSYGIDKVRFNISRHSLDGRHQEPPDVAAFQKLDEVVRYLASRQIVADFIVFTRAQSDAIGEEQGRRFLRYVIARYAAFPNVSWCLQNEWQYTQKPKEFWTALGRFAAAEDPWARRGQATRMLSVHQQTRYDWESFGETWFSHAIIQLGVRNRGKAHRGGDEWNLPRSSAGVFPHGDDWGNFGILYNYGRNLPVVNDEYGYIGEPRDETERRPGGGNVRYTREKHRRTMWGIYIGGGYGSAGNKNLYPGIGQPYKSANWHDEPEYGDIRRLIDFFTAKPGFEYWKMQPHNELVKSGERAYVLAEPTRQYIVYAAAGGKVTLELTGGPYRARRYDPRTGEDIPLPVSISAGQLRFETPAGNDWVVYLRKPS